MKKREWNIHKISPFTILEMNVSSLDSNHCYEFLLHKLQTATSIYQKTTYVRAARSDLPFATPIIIEIIKTHNYDSVAASD